MRRRSIIPKMEYSASWPEKLYKVLFAFNIARKKLRNTRKVGVEIGMQTQTLTIVPPNETGIIGKIAQLKVCLLNSINSLNVI